VLTWEELELAAPEIAAHGRELIERFQFILVGTLTKDGSPRITPVEAYILDGHLLSNMIPRSLKALDLLRDPRVYVHAPVTAKEGSPEFKLAGRAEVLTDETLRGKLARPVLGDDRVAAAARLALLRVPRRAGRVGDVRRQGPDLYPVASRRGQRKAPVHPRNLTRAARAPSLREPCCLRT